MLSSMPKMLAVQTMIGSGLMTAQSVLILAGTVSMFQRKRRWLAIAGAWAGILPMCGCYVMSLISGVWMLVILRRPQIKDLFAAS